MNREHLFRNYPFILEKWRVGLVHIDYPHSWTNISGDIGQVELKKSGFFLLLDHHVGFRLYELFRITLNETLN